MSTVPPLVYVPPGSDQESITADWLVSFATRILDDRDWHDLHRFAEHLRFDEHGCLIWQLRGDGVGRGKGYGRCSWRGHTGFLVHRALFLILHGYVPLVGHTCGRGDYGCGGPHHLASQSRRENFDQAIADGTIFVLRVGGRCRSARHEITSEEDIVWNGQNRTCRQCRTERRALNRDRANARRRQRRNTRTDRDPGPGAR